MVGVLLKEVNEVFLWSCYSFPIRKSYQTWLKVDLPAAGSPDIPCSEDSGWVGACVSSAGSIMTLSIAGRGCSRDEVLAHWDYHCHRLMTWPGPGLPWYIAAALSAWPNIANLIRHTRIIVSPSSSPSPGSSPPCWEQVQCTWPQWRCCFIPSTDFPPRIRSINVKYFKCMADGWKRGKNFYYKSILCYDL